MNTSRPVQLKTLFGCCAAIILATSVLAYGMGKDYGLEKGKEQGRLDASKEGVEVLTTLTRSTQEAIIKAPSTEKEFHMAGDILKDMSKRVDEAYAAFEQIKTGTYTPKSRKEIGTLNMKNDH